MSRGGRGGGRGGRGGGGAGRKGLDVPGYDPEVEKFLSWEPLEKFPAINLPKPHHPNRVEKRQIAYYRALRSQIHEGPLYTVFGSHMNAAHLRGKTGRVSQAASIDPFLGTPTLSDKFRKQHRRIPKLDARPYVMRFFPKELWTTLDPKFDEHAESGNNAVKGKRKVLKIGKSNGNILEELEKAERKFKLENPDADDEDMDQDELEEDDEEKIDEDQDTNYEDEEEDDDDYNAQNYFEDQEYGDDGAGDDYDDGGGGSYD